MSTARRALRNIVSLMVSRPLSKLVAFFVSVWLVRYLGKSLGILDTALGFVALFGYISDFGTQHFVIREISRDRSIAESYLSSFLSLQLVFGVVLFGLIVLIANSFGHYSTLVKQAIYLAGIGLVVTSLSAPFKAIFYAHEAIHIAAILTVVLALAGAVLTAAGILARVSVLFFAGIPIVTGVGLVALSHIICRKRFVLPRLGKDVGLWWRMVKMSLPYALLLGATIIYRKIDIQMLYAMKGRIAVSYYSAVARLINPLTMQVQAIIAAMLPVLSRKFVTSGEQFRFAAEKTLKYVAALGIPMAVGASLLSREIVLLLYGAEFAKSAAALQILSWSLAIGSITLVLTYSAVASGKVLMMAGLNAAAALANVLINLVLIPRYSFRGAALATVISEVALLAAFILTMRGSGTAPIPWRDLGRIVLAVSVMAGFLLLSRSASVFLVIPTGVLIYGGVLLLLGFVAREEKDLLKRALGSGGPPII